MDLENIRVLWRQPDSLALWGIPYQMRADVGQAPRHLYQSGNTLGWVWLGCPGWWGSMTHAERTEVEAFLQKHADCVPQNPGEWCELS